jgi:cobalt/nickel transport system ATP-binding protein
MVAIRVHDLNYAYSDGTVALEHVSFEIARGESVALIGPNGAGKSTLLLHLNGILHSKKSRGAVEILGEPIDPRKVHKMPKKIGIVFQDPDDMLFMPLLGDDVAFGPINLGVAKDEVKRRVKDSLERVGLAGYEERVSHHLSGGEKKRAAIATVLSMDPEIIAMDEPTANLDPKSRAELIEILKGLKSEGKTLIIITHDVNAIPELADRVIVLHKTIVADGTLNLQTGSSSSIRPLLRTERPARSSQIQRCLLQPDSMSRRSCSSLRSCRRLGTRAMCSRYRLRTRLGT